MEPPATVPPADAAALADCDAGNGDNGNVQRGFRRFKTTPDVSAPAPKKSPTVTRRSPGAPRQQSIQILEPEEVLEVGAGGKPKQIYGDLIYGGFEPVMKYCKQSCSGDLPGSLGIFGDVKQPEMVNKVGLSWFPQYEQLGCASRAS